MFYLKCLRGANKDILFVFWASLAKTRGFSQETAAEVWPREILSCAQDGLGTVCRLDLPLTIKTIQECGVRAELGILARRT